MKHVELHVHYLRQLVEEKVVTLVCCKIDEQIVDIFTKPLFEANFFWLHNMLRLQEVTIMGGCLVDVIPPLESLELCVDGALLKPQVRMVHPTLFCHAKNITHTQHVGPLDGWVDLVSRLVDATTHICQDLFHLSMVLCGQDLLISRKFVRFRNYK